MSLLMRLLLLIGIASLPAVAIVAYNEIEVRHAREAEVREQTLRLAQETAAEIERIIEGVRSLLLTLAELPVVRDPSGACTDFLSRLRPNYPDYLVINAANADGLIYCNSVRSARAPNVSDAVSFQGAMAGRFTIGEYRLGRVSDRRLISFGYPYRDEDGTVVGVMLAGLDLDWLGRHLAQKSLPVGTVLSVTDRTGTLLVRSPDSESWVGKPLPERLQSLIRFTKPTVGEIAGLEGTVRIGALVPIPTGPAPDLFVAIGVAKELAFEAVDRATRRDVLLIVIGLTLAVAAALVGGRYFIRRPIEQLTVASTHWRQGDYAARAGLKDRSSELGRLADTFDSMAEALAQREVALGTADERMRLIAGATMLGTWDQDVATQRRVWSDQFYQTLGLPFDAPTTLETVRNLIHPDDVGPSDARYQRALDPANGGDYENEFRIRRYDDGAERWIALRGRIFFDRAGQPTRAVGILLDITENRAAQEAVRRSDAALRLAVEATGIGLWEHDIGTRKMHWAERTKAFFELPADAEVDYKTYIERIHPDDRERLIETHRRAIGAGGEGRFRSEHRALLPSGTVRWLLSIGRVMFDADGRPVRVSGGTLDITERRQAEEATQRMNEILEERVAERTRALSAEMRQREEVEATLRQAQKMQAVGQLAGGVAHDFNNLLTAIAGNLEMLERHQAQETPKRLLRAAMRAVDRGAQLTHRLLAFSRKQHLQPKPVDINRLVGGLGEMMSRTLGGTVHVRMTLDDALWPALVDPTQIELALLNLAINARDAMPDVGVLTIATRNVQIATRADGLASGDYVVIAVADTGSGMSEDVLARAFEPFFTTKEVGKGTGLGLSQVYGVVNQLGGTVRLLSRVGIGTTVELYLPRSHAQVLEESDVRLAMPRPREAVVMVVDDDEDVRELTASSLREVGYRIVEAASGEAALTLIDAGQPVDLLIADFAMPGMNGRVFANEAKARRPGVRVLYVTGYADASALALEPGEILLQKPFRIADLAKHVAEALDRPARLIVDNVVDINRARV